MHVLHARVKREAEKYEIHLYRGENLHKIHLVSTLVLDGLNISYHWRKLILKAVCSYRLHFKLPRNIPFRLIPCLRGRKSRLWLNESKKVLMDQFGLSYNLNYYSKRECTCNNPVTPSRQGKEMYSMVFYGVSRCFSL